MNVSIFLANLLGIYLIIIGIFYLTRGKFVQSVTSNYYSNPAIIVINGAFALIFGLAIFIAHPAFVWSWHLLITVIALLAILKGICSLFCITPNNKMLMKWVQGKNPIYIGIVSIIIGLFLAYHGIIGK